jgi:hypothetical protein
MDKTDTLAPLVADLYEHAAAPQRMRLLNALLRHVGPLALVTVAAGAFATLLPGERWREAQASLDDTRRVGGAQVLALAAYVEQKAPEALTRVVSGARAA